MSRVSLLSRIRRPELARTRSAFSERELRESLLEHLQNMCQTRQGTMLSAPGFGIPDISETLHSYPHAIAQMGQAIAQTIRQFEPRLANVRVSHVPSEETDLILRYEVTAQLDTGEGSVAFETRIDPSRRITFR